jgi:hypothetical protein
MDWNLDAAFRQTTSQYRVFGQLKLPCCKAKDVMYEFLE